MRFAYSGNTVGAKQELDRLPRLAVQVALLRFSSAVIGTGVLIACAIG